MKKFYYFIDRQCFALSFLFVILFYSNNSFGQIYASSQTSSTSGIISVLGVPVNCLGCGTASPSNAADADPNTYSTLISPVGLLSSVSQRLNFPFDASQDDYLTLVIEDPGGLLDVGLLSAVSITTYHDGVSNHDTEYLNSGLLGLIRLDLLDPTNNRYAIQLRPSQIFDAVEIKIGGLASVFNSLRIYYAAFSTSPLSSKFQAVTAEITEQNEALLTWVFPTDLKGGYVVEKSMDGVSFKSISGVITSSADTVQFVDSDRYLSGTVYYRIKYLNDEFVLWSDVKSLSFKEKKGYEIQPNPFNDVLRIRALSSKNENIQISLTTLDGKPVYTNYISAIEEFVITDINVPHGVYNLAIISDDGVHMSRVIKE